MLDQPENAVLSDGNLPLLRRRLEILGWFIVAVLVLTGLSAVVGRALFLIGAMQLAPADPDAAFNAFDVRYYTHSLASLLHLLPGLLVMLLGPVQFMASVRKRHLRWHRLSGRVYVISGLIGAVSGFYFGVIYPFMGFNGQGFNEAMATAFLSVFVVVCLITAVTRAKQKQIGKHREWMIRGFALMLAIATERLMLTAMMATLDIEIAVLFGTTFWMAGILNLIAAEVWIHLTRTPGNGLAHWKDLDQRALAKSAS